MCFSEGFFCVWNTEFCIWKKEALKRLSHTGLTWSIVIGKKSAKVELRLTCSWQKTSGIKHALHISSGNWDSWKLKLSHIWSSRKKAELCDVNEIIWDSNTRNVYEPPKRSFKFQLPISSEISWSMQKSSTQIRQQIKPSINSTWFKACFKNWQTNIVIRTHPLGRFWHWIQSMTEIVSK